MNKKLTILATILTLTGLILFGCVFVASGFDFSKLVAAKYDTATYEISEDFNSISIDTNIADINILPSDTDECRVVCFERQNSPHSVSVEDGKLTVKLVDNRKWYEYIEIFNFTTPKITVYLPADSYKSLSIYTSTGNTEISKGFEFESINVSGITGDIRCLSSATENISLKVNTGKISVENISANDMQLSSSTGDIYIDHATCTGKIEVYSNTGYSSINDVTCKSLTSTGATGKIYLNNVVAQESFYLERGTGGISFDSCDASELFIKTGTGSVNGSLKSEKIFITETGTGHIDVPKTITGGKCEIYTGTGSIYITLTDN